MKSKWHLALQIQILLTIVLAAFIPVANRYRTHTLFTSSHFNWLLISILIVLFIANLFRKNLRINLVVKWLDIFLLPVILIHYLTGITNRILQRYPAQSLIIVIIFFILYLSWLIPIIMADYSAVTNDFARILCVIILVLVLLMSGQLIVTGYADFMTDFTGSLVTNGLALIILLPFLFHVWGMKLRPDLKFNKTSDFQIIVLLLLILFGAWYTFFHNYLYVASSFAEMLWHWDLPITPTWLAFNNSLGSITKSGQN